MSASPNDIIFDATKHQIAAVTVFQSDRAEIRRLVNLDLKVRLIVAKYFR